MGEVSHCRFYVRFTRRQFSGGVYLVCHGQRASKVTMKNVCIHFGFSSDDK